MAGEVIPGVFDQRDMGAHEVARLAAAALQYGLNDLSVFRMRAGEAP